MSPCIPSFNQVSNRGASSSNARAAEIPTEVNPNSFARRLIHAARSDATCLDLDMGQASKRSPEPAEGVRPKWV